MDFEFAAGTLAVGDVFLVRCTAPNFSAAEITSALVAAKQTSITWDQAVIVGPQDATIFDAVELEFGNMPDKAWLGQVRTPNLGESEAAYLTSLSGAFSSKATPRGLLCAGAAEITSALPGARKYRRSILTAVASLAGFVTEEIDLAEIGIGNLVATSIRDANGNPKHHDERINPGLDDARFCTLRTHENIAGVYVNNPRILSTAGSDFEFLQHRRVINISKAALRIFLALRMSRAIQVDKSTGFILESVALEIETAATAAQRGVLLAKPKASAVTFTLSRNDNLLSTKKLTGQLKVTPLAYPKEIEIEVGFENPALQVETV